MRVEPGCELRDLRQLARGVHLPEAREPAHLALEVAGRFAEPVKARGHQVDRVKLGERVDQLETQARPLLR
jgi:hypothetical protein